jgi:glycine reductase
VCGDNYFVENEDAARSFVANALAEHKPDVVVAGPTFDSGRYGLAAGLVCGIAQENGIPAISAMEPDNPGVSVYRREMICIPTGSNVAEMGQIMGQLAKLASKLGAGEELGSAEDEGYIPRGYRKDVDRELTGAERAVNMTLARIKGEAFTSEVVIRDYDKVEAPQPLDSLSGIKVGIITSGGLVPKGNPDKLAAARADQYFHYDISDMDELKVGEWETIHGGYGHHWVNERDPNYVVPLRSLRKLEAKGEIGSIYPQYISTVGNQTSIAYGKQFGEEIAKEFKEAGVGAVVVIPT